MAPAVLRAQSNDDCLACHSDPSLTTERRGRTVSLHVDAAALGASAHAGLSCVDCHTGLDPNELPHARTIRPVRCLECHADAPGAHPFHPALAHATGTDGGPAVSCKGCHGTHDVKPVSDPAFPFRPAAMAAACGRCHVGEARDYRASAHGQALAAGEKGAPGCLSCHTLPMTPARNGGVSAERKLAQEKVCLSCHLDDPNVRARMGPDAGFIAAYENSVHGRALAAGNGGAANCVDCHGSHTMQKGFEPTSRVNKRRIPETCGACHGGIERTYERSVHGVAVHDGNLDAPVCTDCHGEHNILAHLDPRSPVAPGNVSARVCSPCHSSLRLSEKYGIASDRFQTFSDSYHGLAIRGGQIAVANCASCHGAHDILPSSDPASSVNKNNLARTCGRCHPGANRRFGVGAVHLALTRGEEPILYWIATAYVILIVGIVGGMLVHNLADFVRKSRRILRTRRGGADDGDGEEPARGHALYLRMTPGERLQHGALMASFTVLVITGFMLHYPDAWWVVELRRLSDRLFALRSLTHRVAAVVMVGASLAHLGYLGFTARGRQFLRDILPRPGDATDAARMLGYNLGLSRERPRFGRFSYIEKSEYWALVWGTMLMTLTGAILWFENTFIGLLTKLGWDIARTIHFYEAWLATLAILAWHIYFVIFNPDVYPMNLAWLKGTLSETEMEEEHPLELEAIRRRRLLAEDEEARALENAGAPPDREGGKSDGTSLSPGSPRQEGGTGGRDAE
jgi:cytochrome b subunit of formate dehydrogenase